MLATLSLSATFSLRLVPQLTRTQTRAQLTRAHRTTSLRIPGAEAYACLAVGSTQERTRPPRAHAYPPCPIATPTHRSAPNANCPASAQCPLPLTRWREGSLERFLGLTMPRPPCPRRRRRRHHRRRRRRHRRYRCPPRPRRCPRQRRPRCRQPCRHPHHLRPRRPHPRRRPRHRHSRPCYRHRRCRLRSVAAVAVTAVTVAAAAILPTSTIAGIGADTVSLALANAASGVQTPSPPPPPSAPGRARALP